MIESGMGNADESPTPQGVVLGLDPQLRDALVGALKPAPPASRSLTLAGAATIVQIAAAVLGGLWSAYTYLAYERAKNEVAQAAQQIAAENARLDQRIRSIDVQDREARHIHLDGETIINEAGPGEQIVTMRVTLRNGGSSEVRVERADLQLYVGDESRTPVGSTPTGHLIDTPPTIVEGTTWSLVGQETFVVPQGHMTGTIERDETAIEDFTFRVPARRGQWISGRVDLAMTVGGRESPTMNYLSLCLLGATAGIVHCPASPSSGSTAATPHPESR